MKCSWHACLALGVCCTATAARAGFLRNGRGESSGSDTGTQTGKSQAQTELTNMVVDMMLGKGPGLSEMAKHIHNKMDLATAVKQLDGKLPKDVTSLIHMTNHRDGGEFDEASMQKARKILNNMMLTAWGELDDVVFKCKEFQERNRGTYEQVVADLARLGSQLARLGELQVVSMQGIEDKDNERKAAEDRLDKLTVDFEKILFENQREMKIRKNDLAVFDFILQATACKDGAFIQINNPSMQICQTMAGPTLNFKDRNLQTKFEQMMTPESRRALEEALGQVQRPLGLIQVGQTTSETETTTALPTYAATVVPVSEDPHPAGQWKKCVDGEPNCGLLHDLMSIEWGKFRDGFDELTAEMNQNKQEFDGTKGNINEELTVISDEKTKHMEVLANTISSINADTEEMNEKDQQKRDLTHEFDKTCKVFREQIEEILFTRICAVRKVRNELLEKSTESPPSKFSDCDFSDWASKTGQCIDPMGIAILCDDSCPKDDPYKCGGYETMKRDVVVLPDKYGMRCPQLEREKKMWSEEMSCGLLDV